MKKTLLLFSFFASLLFFAQNPVITPSNPTINDVITITYGPGTGNNWAYLDPQGDSTLYLYLGVDTDNNVATWEYNDKWNNCDPSNLIAMPYNSATGKFEATFDLRSHNFDGTGGFLATGLTAYNAQFIIRRANTYECAPSGATSSSWQGTNQSFGITPATVIMAVNDTKTNNLNNAKIIDGKIFFVKAGDYNVKIYDFNGNIIKSLHLDNVNQKTMVPLDFATGKIGFCVLEDQNGNRQVIKFKK